MRGISTTKKSLSISAAGSIRSQPCFLAVAVAAFFAVQNYHPCISLGSMYPTRMFTYLVRWHLLPQGGNLVNNICHRNAPALLAMICSSKLLEVGKLCYQYLSHSVAVARPLLTRVWSLVRFLVVASCPPLNYSWPDNSQPLQVQLRSRAASASV